MTQTLSRHSHSIPLLQLSGICGGDSQLQRTSKRQSSKVLRLKLMFPQTQSQTPQVSFNKTKSEGVLSLKFKNLQAPSQELTPACRKGVVRLNLNHTEKAVKLQEILKNQKVVIKRVHKKKLCASVPPEVKEDPEEHKESPNRLKIRREQQHKQYVSANNSEGSEISGLGSAVIPREPRRNSEGGVFLSNCSTSFQIESGVSPRVTPSNRIQTLKYEKNKIQQINEILKQSNTGQETQESREVLFEEFIGHLTSQNDETSRSSEIIQCFRNFFQSYHTSRKESPLPTKKLKLNLAKHASEKVPVLNFNRLSHAPLPPQGESVRQSKREEEKTTSTTNETAKKDKKKKAKKIQSFQDEFMSMYSHFSKSWRDQINR